MLQTFTVPLVVTVMLSHHHFDLHRIQRINFPQLCHTVSRHHHTPLVDQSSTAHQQPVRGLTVAVTCCSSDIFLRGPRQAVCLGHLGLHAVGGAAVDGCQPRPVRVDWPLLVKGWMLPTHYKEEVTG